MAEFSNATSEPEITLISSDGDEFKVSHKVASMSGLATTMIGDDDGEDEKRVPLPNVKKEILSKVLEFCNHYQEEPMTEFVKVGPPNLMDKENFYQLTLAANYMDIKPLLDLCCAKVASLIKGKTPEEIRVNLDISNDFTPEEEAKVREENKWAEDL
eukprot:scaffold644_cov168-Ochromonas_danica.AAC.38